MSGSLNRKWENDGMRKMGRIQANPTESDL